MPNVELTPRERALLKTIKENGGHIRPGVLWERQVLAADNLVDRGLLIFLEEEYRITSAGWSAI